MEAITDWDDAYANGTWIPGGADWFARWEADARAFAAAHPAREGLVLPDGEPRGLAVIVHGGYWMKFAPETFSHLAAGARAWGWAVLLPRYTLAPAARLTEIAREVAAQVRGAAARVPGPIALSGHSAGGHLAARLVCDDALLGEAGARVARCVPISGLFDLRPLLRTAMNETLRLDPAEAASESPALRAPLPGIPLTAWVGGAERPEFRRQSQLIANIWRGLGAETAYVEDGERHHFDVIAGLTDPESPLTRALLA